MQLSRNTWTSLVHSLREVREPFICTSIHLVYLTKYIYNNAGLVDLSGHALLATHVECVEVTEFNGEGSDEVESDRVSSSNARLFVHVFRLSNVSNWSYYGIKLQK